MGVEDLKPRVELPVSMRCVSSRPECITMATAPSTKSLAGPPFTQELCRLKACQNCNFRATCMFRGEFAWPVTRPYLTLAG